MKIRVDMQTSQYGYSLTGEVVAWTMSVENFYQDDARWPTKLQVPAVLLRITGKNGDFDNSIQLVPLQKDHYNSKIEVLEA